MATVARRREAEQASIAFHQALTQLGVMMAVETLTLWKDVPAQPGIPGWARWLPRMVQLVLLRRRQTRELAESYYRLQRALLTDTTFARPDEEPGETLPLDALRSEFNGIIGYNYADEPQAGDADRDPIVLEDLSDVDQEITDTERDAEEAIATTLENLSRASLEAKMRDAANGAERADELDAGRSKAHNEAGVRTAAAMARHAMNGARSDLFARATRDPRVLGYVRTSQTGTPCAFCAMLMSRQVAYKTEAAAAFRVGDDGGYASLSYEDGDRYHDNCQCYPHPVYAQVDYDESSRFDLNREYAEMWPRVTEGLSGAAARRAWRRYIDESRQAQAAAPTPDAQEA